MKIVQINSSCGSGSTGKIALAIQKKLNTEGIENYIFYSGYKICNEPNCIVINTKKDIRVHQVLSRIFGNQGWHSTRATKRMIKVLKKIQPDLVHLHNLHGYYLNMTVLFNYLAKAKIPVVWTLHDCWAFTGHCSHFTKVKCEQWKVHCSHCSQKKEYPYSLIFDRSKGLFRKKKKLYERIKDIKITTVSTWLREVTGQSALLGERDVRVISNGINCRRFFPTTPLQEIQGIHITNKKIVLGVASTWSARKGLTDFLELRKSLSKDYLIVLVGLNNAQIGMLPEGILGIERTQNVEELVALYSTANVFFNASEEETFGLTTIEALSCGTPVIVYRSTACAEPVKEGVGSIVEPGNLQAVLQEINKWCALDKQNLASHLHQYVQDNYDEQNIYQQYVDLYKEVVAFRESD